MFVFGPNFFSEKTTMTDTQSSKISSERLTIATKKQQEREKQLKKSKLCDRANKKRKLASNSLPEAKKKKKEESLTTGRLPENFFNRFRTSMLQGKCNRQRSKLLQWFDIQKCGTVQHIHRKTE